jgi:uncharacterized membrane protein YqjE
MQGPEGKKPGIVASLKRVLKTVVAIAENRLELLVVEWHEERLRAFELLVLAGLVLVLALMTLMVVTMTIVVVCINNGRIGVVIGLSLVYLLATIGAYWRLRTRLKNWAPFPETLAEIKKDRACLEDKS